VKSKVFISFLMLTFLSLPMGAAQLPSESHFDRPAPEWREGPVRYILTSKEDAEYGQLSTEAERQVFIRNFWERLNPSSEASSNQRHAEFWRRVDQANNLFHDAIFPGWKSDRGKAYILLGPPNEVQLHVEEEIWSYWTIPDTERPIESQLTFRRSASGMMSLSQRPSRSSRESRGAEGTPHEDSFISRVLNVGGAQFIPGRFFMNESSIKTEYYFPALNPAWSYRTYRAGEGKTLVVIDIYFPKDQFRGHIPPRSSPDVSLSAAISPVKGGGKVVSFSKSLGSNAGHLESSPGTKMFQTAFELSPGDYGGEFTVVERWSHFGASFNRTLTVPDYDKDFSLSSVTVTRSSETLQGKLPDSVAFAYFSQGDKAFKRDETLYLAYRVYNATQSESGTDVRVAYRFCRQVRGKTDEVIYEVAYDHVPRELLSYSQSLGDWLEGDYRVQINVVDNHSGASASTQADFVVVAGASR